MWEFVAAVAHEKWQAWIGLEKVESGWGDTHRKVERAGDSHYCCQKLRWFVVGSEGVAERGVFVVLALRGPYRCRHYSFYLSCHIELEAAVIRIFQPGKTFLPKITYHLSFDPQQQDIPSPLVRPL